MLVDGAAARTNPSKPGYDYIIVGAGTAGCVLTHRLSADGSRTVLLLEHGGDDRHWLLRMSAGLRSVFKPSSRFNYWYQTLLQPHLKQRRIDQPWGKVLGSSPGYSRSASDPGLTAFSVFQRPAQCPGAHLDPLQLRLQGRPGHSSVQA